MHDGRPPASVTGNPVQPPHEHGGVRPDMGRARTGHGPQTNLPVFLRDATLQNVNLYYAQLMNTQSSPMEELDAADVGLPGKSPGSSSSSVCRSSARCSSSAQRQTPQHTPQPSQRGPSPWHRSAAAAIAARATQPAPIHGRTDPRSDAGRRGNRRERTRRRHGRTERGSSSRNTADS